ncbi:MAG: DUF4349 domain-containing protein [Leptospiraceae bacterium]|nr:DUF4349 domain-containing protein [Leptospiraceae bacterium]
MMKLVKISITVMALLLSGALFAETNAQDQESTRLEYSVRTESSDLFVDEIMAYASKNGGYLVALSSSRAEFRIPARLGREAIEARIAAVPGTNLYHSSRTTEDVSADLVDLRARLRVAEDNLGKLRALSTSAGIDDLLDLEKALQRSLQEVEDLKGQIRYLEESSDLFLVRIQINSIRDTSDPAVVPIPWIRNLTVGSVTGGL